jgi:CheY-like chemotaxis protein
MRSSSSEPSAVRSILLVDDHALGLAARKSVLQEAGYRVVTASCAAEALERFGSESFDLLVTDYRMPRMNGIELIQKVRAEGYQLPVVLMSGVANALGLNEANTGADVVIQKSANEVAHLLRAAERLLKRKAPRKPAASERPSLKTRRKSV